MIDRDENAVAPPLAMDAHPAQAWRHPLGGTGISLFYSNAMIVPLPAWMRSRSIGHSGIMRCIQ